MREILFRGKRLDNGEWVYGYLVVKSSELLDITYWFILSYHDKNSFVTWHRVDPATVGQYTGLDDNDGVKIFEGDVLLFVDPSTGERHEDEQYVMRWWDKCVGFATEVFYRGKSQSLELLVARCANFLVIGNIHDNPELLEGGGGK